MQLETEFEERMKENFKKLYHDQLGLKDWRLLAGKKIKGEQANDLIELLERYIGLENKKILDVGSGWGEFVASVNLHGAKAFGIEPDEEEIKLSKMRLMIKKLDNTVFMGVGENLPFKDNIFDIVCCYSVLEHVQNRTKVIDEMVRVLKKGGFCHITAPNYLFPREAHYKIFWIPFLPKKLAKFYLMLRSRPTSFLEHFDYITPYSILRDFQKLDVEIRNITEERIRNPNLINSKRWRIIAKVIKHLHLPSWAINLISPHTVLVVKKIRDNDGTKGN